MTTPAAHQTPCRQSYMQPRCEQQAQQWLVMLGARPKQSSPLVWATDTCWRVTAKTPFPHKMSATTVVKHCYPCKAPLGYSDGAHMVECWKSTVAVHWHKHNSWWNTTQGCTKVHSNTKYITFSLVRLGNKLALRKMLQIVPAAGWQLHIFSGLRVNTAWMLWRILGRLLCKCQIRHGQETQIGTKYGMFWPNIM